MQMKTLLPAALLAAAASAQNATGMMNLTALLSSNSDLSALSTLLGSYPTVAASLANATNITLFAPSNQAIEALMASGAARGASPATIQALLNYHTLAGEVYAANITEVPTFAHTMLNSTMYSNVTGGQVVEARLVGENVTLTSGLKMTANVTMADVAFTGGVVHIIDSVLNIPYNVSTTAVAANLTYFAGALSQAGLLTALDVAHDVTIFAPANSAFEAIASALGNLTMANLTSILEYHVINGTIAYGSSLGNGTVASMGGRNLTITVEDGAAFVNNARIINSDILISGGVMHVIDSVLNPANGTTNATMPDAMQSSAVVQFSGAHTASASPYTSGVPTATTTVANLVATTEDVASGYPTQTGGAVGTGAGGARASSSSSSGIAAGPTGMVGAAALFGGAAFLANW